MLLHEDSRAIGGNSRLRWITIGRADLAVEGNANTVAHAVVDLPGGGRRAYGFPESTTDPYGYSPISYPHHRDGSVLHRLGGGALALNYRQGRQIVYSAVVNNTGYSVYYLATKFINRRGHSITLNYQGGSLPRIIVDADGRTTPLGYATVNGKEYFTGVTTPDSKSFGVTCGTYSPAGWYLPATITDAAGIVSSVNYVQNDQGSGFSSNQGAPSALTTPYGTTAFDHQAGEAAFERFLLATDPLAGKRAFAIVINPAK